MENVSTYTKGYSNAPSCRYRPTGHPIDVSAIGYLLCVTLAFCISDDVFICTFVTYHYQIVALYLVFADCSCHSQIHFLGPKSVIHCQREISLTHAKCSIFMTVLNVTDSLQITGNRMCNAKRPFESHSCALPFNSS